MRKLIVVILLFNFFSCSDSETTKDSQDWCKYLALGEYSFEKDKVKAEVNFLTNDIDKTIAELNVKFIVDGFSSFNISSNTRAEEIREESNKFILKLNEIVLNKVYSFDVVSVFGGISSDGSALNDGYDLNSDSYLKQFQITFLDDGTIEFECENIDKLIEEWYEINDSTFNKSILTKSQGTTECFDFNDNISYDLFSNHQAQFIDHDLSQGEGWQRASKEVMIGYCFDYDTGGWNEIVTGRLKQYGTTFSLDLNNDSEMDLGGYFIKKHETNSQIYFKVFLNNGVTYNEIFSENVQAHILHPIYTPDILNGKNVLRIDYVDKDLTNYLYYDKLEGKLKEYLTD
jgi:hypothetical protein